MYKAKKASFQAPRAKSGTDLSSSQGPSYQSQEEAKKLANASVTSLEQGTSPVGQVMNTETEKPDWLKYMIDKKNKKAEQSTDSEVESQSLLSVSPSSYSSREDYQDLAQVKWGDGRLSSLCSLGARNDDNIRGYQTSSQGAPETQSLDDDSQIERNNDKDDAEGSYQTCSQGAPERQNRTDASQKSRLKKRSRSQESNTSRLSLNWNNSKKSARGSSQTALPRIDPLALVEIGSVADLNDASVPDLRKAKEVLDIFHKIRSKKRDEDENSSQGSQTSSQDSCYSLSPTLGEPVSASSIAPLVGSLADLGSLGPTPPSNNVSEEGSALEGEPDPQKNSTAVPQKDLAAAVPQNDLVAAVPHADLAAAVPLNDLVAAVPHDDLAAAVPHNDLVAAVPHNDLAAAVPHIDLAAAVPLNDLVAAVPHDDLAAAVPHNDLVAEAPQNALVTAASQNALAAAVPHNALVAAASHNDLAAAVPQNDLAAPIPQNDLAVADDAALENSPAIDFGNEPCFQDINENTPPELSKEAPAEPPIAKKKAAPRKKPTTINQKPGKSARVSLDLGGISTQASDVTGPTTGDDKLATNQVNSSFDGGQTTSLQDVSGVENLVSSSAEKSALAEDKPAADGDKPKSIEALASTVDKLTARVEEPTSDAKVKANKTKQKVDKTKPKSDKAKLKADKAKLTKADKADSAVVKPVAKTKKTSRKEQAAVASGDGISTAKEAAFTLGVKDLVAKEKGMSPVSGSGISDIRNVSSVSESVLELRNEVSITEPPADDSVFDSLPEASNEDFAQPPLVESSNVENIESPAAKISKFIPVEVSKIGPGSSVKPRESYLESQTNASRKSSKDSSSSSGYISKKRGRPATSITASGRRTNNEEISISQTKEEMLELLRKRAKMTTWVNCDKPDCGKWRRIDEQDPSVLPRVWFCKNNTDIQFNSCDMPEEVADPQLKALWVENRYTAGSVVWIKMQGWPTWPAMIDDDPDTGAFFWTRTGSEQRPISYHAVFFDTPRQDVSRAWIMNDKISPFKGAKLEGTGRLRTSIGAALEAVSMEIVPRREKFCFANRFRGPWGPSWLVNQRETNPDDPSPGLDTSVMDTSLSWRQERPPKQKKLLQQKPGKEDLTIATKPKSSLLKKTLINRVHDTEGGITEGTEYAHNRPKAVVGTGSRKAAAAVAKKLSKKAKRKQKVDKATEDGTPVVKKLNPLTRPMRMSAELQAIVGGEEKAVMLARSEIVKRLWIHLKAKNLQDPENRQFFTPDELMEPVFGNERIKAFSMAKYLKDHLSNVEGDVNPKTDATLNPGDPETDVTLETSVSKLNESATPIVAKKSAPKQVAEEKPSDKVTTQIPDQQTSKPLFTKKTALETCVGNKEKEGDSSAPNVEKKISKPVFGVKKALPEKNQGDLKKIKKGPTNRALVYSDQSGSDSSADSQDEFESTWSQLKKRKQKRQKKSPAGGKKAKASRPLENKENVDPRPSSVANQGAGNLGNKAGNLDNKAGNLVNKAGNLGIDQRQNPRPANEEFKQIFNKSIYTMEMSEKADEGKMGAEGDASISFPYDVMAELNDSKFGQTIQGILEHLSAEEEEEEDPCTQKSSSLYPEENYKETKAMPEEAVIAVTKEFSSTVKGSVDSDIFRGCSDIGPSLGDQDQHSQAKLSFSGLNTSLTEQSVKYDEVVTSTPTNKLKLAAFRQKGSETPGPAAGKMVERSPCINTSLIPPPLTPIQRINRPRLTDEPETDQAVPRDLSLGNQETSMGLACADESRDFSIDESYDD